MEFSSRQNLFSADYSDGLISTYVGSNLVQLLRFVTKSSDSRHLRGLKLICDRRRFPGRQFGSPQ